MSFSVSTVLIAIATFLWYRKGKLWNFYDNLLSQCLKQIDNNSLDRTAWDEIALKQCDVISQETFQSLFRFEVEYLRQRVIENQHAFWIPESQLTSETNDKLGIALEITTTYTNQKQYCRYKIRNTFFPEFRFCGCRLFFNALRHNNHSKEDTNAGFKEKRVTTKHGRTETDRL